ncbi:MAG: nuclear transport factor 2 family protein [Thermoplasmatales archaeon]|nr:MAG: nuclear transport factor 2 family protein [Thermoplasmatales archaeon]
MNNQLKEQLISKTKEFFHFLEAKDIDQWIELWSEDCINRQPFGMGMFPEEIIGKKALYENFKPIPNNFETISFPIQEIIVDTKNRTVVARVNGDLAIKNGGYYRNTYIFLFHYDNANMIKECYEYYNPYLAGKAFGLLDKLKF